MLTNSFGSYAVDTKILTYVATFQKEFLPMQIIIGFITHLVLILFIWTFQNNFASDAIAVYWKHCHTKLFVKKSQKSIVKPQNGDF